jgi:hypothetical protein
MGVTNYDNLRENKLETTLRESRQVRLERKGSSQRVAGANLRYFRTDNTGEFAWTGQADLQSPQSPSTGGAFFTVTLEAETTPIFLHDLVVELYTSSDSGSTWDPVAITSTTHTYTLQPAAEIIITPHEAAYLLSLAAPLDTYMAFKLQALTTAPVTIAVERIE